MEKPKPNSFQRQLLLVPWVTSSLSYTILTKIRCINKLPDLQPEELIGGNLHRKSFLNSCWLVRQESEKSLRRKDQGPNKLNKKEMFKRAIKRAIFRIAVMFQNVFTIVCLAFPRRASC